MNQAFDNLIFTRQTNSEKNLEDVSPNAEVLKKEIKLRFGKAPEEVAAASRIPVSRPASQHTKGACSLDACSGLARLLLLRLLPAFF